MTIVISTVICVAIGAWAWMSRRIDRQALVIASIMLTFLALVGYLVAGRLKWWHGIFVEDVPLDIQIATLLPTALLGWLVWLGVYSWLVPRVRHPRLMYLVVGTLLVVAAAIADRLEVSNGLIEVGDGNVWISALVLLALMFIPLIVYDAVRHSMARELLP